MRYSRQSKILEIIKNDEIYTQEELAQRLAEEGYKATQATISRDIKELGLIKGTGRSGKNCYVITSEYSGNVTNKFGKILSETILNIKSAENLIVITTLSGCAGAAAEVIDRIKDDAILGTIAGDNTILLIADKKDNVSYIEKRIREVIS